MEANSPVSRHWLAAGGAGPAAARTRQTPPAARRRWCAARCSSRTPCTGPCTRAARRARRPVTSATPALYRWGSPRALHPADHVGRYRRQLIGCLQAALCLRRRIRRRWSAPHEVRRARRGLQLLVGRPQPQRRPEHACWADPSQSPTPAASCPPVPAAAERPERLPADCPLRPASLPCTGASSSWCGG